MQSNILGKRKEAMDDDDGVSLKEELSLTLNHDSDEITS